MKKLLCFVFLCAIILIMPFQARAAQFRRMNDEQFLELCYSGSAQDIINAIHSGANVNAKNSNNWTALMLALEKNSIDVISALLNAGANGNARGPHTPLTIAVRNRNIDIISTMINAGADINAKDNEDTAPLIWAIERNSPEILNILIKAGADVNTQQTRVGWIALTKTALMIAVEKGNLTIIEALINAGANVHIRNELGQTVLLWAARYSTRPDIIDALIDAGADDTFDKERKTAIITAAQYNGPAVLNALLDAGAYAKGKDTWGKTAVDYARQNPNLKGTSAMKRLEEAVGEKSIKTPTPSSQAQNMTPEEQYSRAFQYYIPPGDTRKGIKQNNAEAMKWFRMAAERGHREAQFWLGHMYVVGAGVEQNDIEAVKWWRKAAESGLPLAQYWLGHKYMNGQGVKKDEIEALNYWRKAAKEMQEARDEIKKYTVGFDAKGFIAGDKVNVRTEPYTSTNIVRQLNTGHPVEVTQKNGDWYFIQTASGTKGWVFEKYVKLK